MIEPVRRLRAGARRDARSRSARSATARASTPRRAPGIIKEFTGISDPYEEPADADLVIDTTRADARGGGAGDPALPRARGLRRRRARSEHGSGTGSADDLRADLERIAAGLEARRELLAALHPRRGRRAGARPAATRSPRPTPRSTRCCAGLLPRDGEGWLSEETHDDPRRLDAPAGLGGRPARRHPRVRRGHARVVRLGRPGRGRRAGGRRHPEPRHGRDDPRRARATGVTLNGRPARVTQPRRSLRRRRRAGEPQRGRARRVGALPRRALHGPPHGLGRLQAGAGGRRASPTPPGPWCPSTSGTWPPAWPWCSRRAGRCARSTGRRSSSTSPGPG